MPTESAAPVVRQGSSEPWHERMPMPSPEAMSTAQRAAADALIAGPRKGVYGPFLPLLRTPQLLDRVAALGEQLRFHSSLETRVRELVTCAAARHTTNQFEWLMHAPLAIKAGVAESTIAALQAGARPTGLAADEETALDFARELLHTHGVSEPAYAAALAQFGEAGVVELATLIGYFVMVCWVMNVARTPAQAGAQGAPLKAFPL
jgi:4-carboxymuconolactone decarboxylase